MFIETVKEMIRNERYPSPFYFRIAIFHLELAIEERRENNVIYLGLYSDISK